VEGNAKALVVNQKANTKKRPLVNQATKTTKKLLHLI
jgi:hypothetical protein